MTQTAKAQRVPAAERRSQLVSAAALRFQSLGYHGVSMADVAADVGFTAPAVYRHFPSKQALLAAAITAGLIRVDAVIGSDAGDSLETLIDAVAELSLELPNLWTLLQREARFLDTEQRHVVHDHFESIVAQFVTRLVARRPELIQDDARMLVTAATAALGAPSVGRGSSKRMVTKELATAALAILRLSLPTGELGSSTPISVVASVPESRRDELLESAIDLFCERGYAAVSLDDIGSSIGIAGPSIYHHFATKTDILIAAFSRAVERLGDAAGSYGPRRPTLDELVAGYVDFCLRNRRLVGVYVSEVMNLPLAVQRQIRSVLRDRVQEWTAALVSENDTTDGAAAKVRCRAALTVIDDLARLGHFYARPAISGEITAIGLAVLRA